MNFKNTTNFIFLLTFLSFLNISFAQTEEEDENMISLPEGLGFSNQLEYSYDINKKLEIFEDWLNLDYRQGIFSTGIRFETFQPNDPNPAINRGKKRFAEISFKYIKVEIGDAKEGGEITVGNFYTLFGRGIVLKSYEERNIRIDNNLLGVKLEGRYSNFVLTALAGMPENINAERTDILHAVDLEYRGLKELKLGGSFASNQPDVEGMARTRLASLRIQPSIWNIDFYGEFAVKQNDDIKEKVFKGNETIAGKGFYSNLNFYLGSFSISGEYKLYDNIAFKTNDQTVDYNTPSSLRKDYTYILLNRHPSPLNPNNEQGFQVEVNYTFDDETYFNGNYGLTKTLSQNSYYQRILGSNLSERVQLKEIYLQGAHSWNDKFASMAAFGYNEELDANTKNITPILENKFYFDEVNTIRLILEHQFTTDRTTSEQYYTDVVTLEYLRSPKINISIVSELQTKEPQIGRRVRKFWGFIQFGYKIGEHTDASLLIGTRQAGNICIGGVCRYEPEFSGVELKMFTRF